MVTKLFKLELSAGTYLTRQSAHISRFWKILKYEVVASCLVNDLLDAQGTVLRGCDVHDIRVLERLFLTAHDILHEVYGYALVGRQVLVTVHGEKAKRTHNQKLVLNLLVDLLLALVLGGKALCCHQWVALWRISLCHAWFDVDACYKNKDGYMAETNQILF